MNKSNSLFMDGLRVFAALLVFLGHLSYTDFLGNFVWGAPLAEYGFDAVIIFFVLSGFVIGFVADVKEKTGPAYSIARFSRLASVLWPALLITVGCDVLGHGFNPSFYDHAWWYSNTHPVARFGMNMLALNQVAGQDIRAFSNGPLWSVSYEAWYYLIFGCWYFLPRWRWPACALGLLLSGPSVAMLFPIWVMGYALYRSTKTTTLPPVVGLLIALAGIVVYALTKAAWGVPHNPQSLFGMRLPGAFWGRTESLGGAYMTGLCSAALLGGTTIFMRNFDAKHIPFERVIRKLSDCTFPLYATHYSVIWAIAAVHPTHDAARTAALLLVPLLVAYLLSIVARILRDWIRQAADTRGRARPA